MSPNQGQRSHDQLFINSLIGHLLGGGRHAVEGVTMTPVQVHCYTTEEGQHAHAVFASIKDITKGMIQSATGPLPLNILTFTEGNLMGDANFRGGVFPVGLSNTQLRRLNGQIVRHLGLDKKPKPEAATAAPVTMTDDLDRVIRTQVQGFKQGFRSASDLLSHARSLLLSDKPNLQRIEQLISEAQTKMSQPMLTAMSGEG